METGKLSPPDSELLKRFIASGDEGAFAQLVQRHGAYILGVCRRLTSHAQDAEDIFQSCFLELARRAQTICKRDSVVAWLQAVAVRMARRASMKRGRQRRQLAMVGATKGPAVAPDDLTWFETRKILEEEIERLPEQLRLPIILCFFQGLTQEEASRRLGMTYRTLRARLARGRRVLHKRLTRRGLVFAALGAVLSTEVDAVPIALSALTVRAASALMKGLPLAGIVSPAVLTLTSKPALATWMIVLALGLGLGGAAALLHDAESQAAGETGQFSPGATRDSHVLPASLSRRAAAQRTAAKTAKPAGADDLAERGERLEEMRDLASRLVLEEPGTNPPQRHALIKEPLLHFSDADRGLFDGTLWAYGEEGRRPVAFVEMYCGPGSHVYRHATTGTCDRPLELSGAPGIAWTPKSSAISWTALEGSQPPSPEPRLRLRQMKAIAQRFSAHQIFEPTKQREELRLLAQPLVRYSDAGEKIRDGTVFALALGTNPEALLFLEAREDDQGAPAWHYGWARRGAVASIHGFLDGQEVWSVKRLIEVTPDDPYIHFCCSPKGTPRLDPPSGPFDIKG